MTSPSDGNGFLPNPTSDEDTIAVHSLVQTWYLTTLRGYRVVRRSASPTPGWFGSIGYKRTWVLKRAE